MNNVEKILERIRKLLAVANDDRANANEAATAAAMAATMMAKYQIEESDVVLAELKKAENMDTAEVIATAKTNGTPVKAVPLWASQLATVVSRFYDCGALVVRQKDGQKAVRFYGYKADVTICAWSYHYLITMINRAVSEYRWTDHYQAVGRTAAHAYRQGFLSSILINLDNARREREQANKSSEVGTALVVAKQEAITEKFGDVFATKKIISRSKIDRNSYTDGMIDGQKVDVTHKALEGSQSSNQTLTA